MAKTWKALSYSEYYLENYMFDFLGDPQKLGELVDLYHSERTPEERGAVTVFATDSPCSFWPWEAGSTDGIWETPGLHDLISATDPAEEMIVVFWGGPETRTFAVRVRLGQFRFGVREALEPYRRGRPGPRQRRSAEPKS